MRVVALMLACTLQPLSAGRQWIQVSTSHFEMYTTDNEQQAERALQTFEQVRYFFFRNNRNGHESEGRVRIIAFSSEGEFKSYRMNSGNFAFYLRSRERDYIVMQDIQPDHLQAAAHEYTHLVIRHSRLELPLWLDEGLADLYSSLEPRGQQALVGRPPSQHMITLQARPWMDYDRLFAVDHGSPYYNQNEKMQVFYAQSWELTHMLALSPAYRSSFPEFLLALNAGASTADALQEVYGKSVADLARDAQNYARRTTVPAAVFEVTLKKADLNPQVEPLSDLRTGLALCDLLASRPETAGEAHRRLITLERENPQEPDVHESLGYLAWQENDQAEARRQFRMAADQGSKDGRMFYDYANLEHMAARPPQTILDLMKKAVELMPDDNNSRILLAQLLLGEQLPGQALGVLAPIHAVEPDQAFNFYVVIADCHANLKNLSGARSSIQKAGSFAKTPAQQQQVEQMTRYLDAAERSIAAK